MAKTPTLTDQTTIIGNEPSVVNALNNNWDAIITAFENTLSRDGSTPNNMNANLDMNGYAVINSSGLTIANGAYGDITVTTGNYQITTGVIIDADISGSAAINATKIADGSISNTEFQYLNGLTGNIQTQINALSVGSYAVTTDPLSQFAATTSVQLASVISDETGSGALVFANTPTLVSPILGTPTSGVLTNCTGTAAGLTAGNVTTNANLTGDVTSVGNATSIAAGVIMNADVNASAAIDATKIHDGTVSNTEFGYLNGVTSAIQTQLDAKGDVSYVAGSAAAGDKRMVRLNGASGTDIQSTGIGVSDTNVITNASYVVPINGIAFNDDAGSGFYDRLHFGTTLTADRTLTITKGDANRTLDISAADVTITAAAASVLDDASTAAMLTTLGAQPLDATLTAVAGLNATAGMVVQTGADAFTKRTITGTANEISVADGDGAAAAPTISLPAEINLGDKTSLEIPNSAAPTVDADGEIALDTTVADISGGLLKVYAGEVFGAVMMPIAQFTAPTNGYVPTYNSTTDDFELSAPTAVVGDGDKGDITITGGNWAIDPGVVTLAKMADLAQDAFIIRTTASTGVPETATCTAAARSVLDDATVAAMVDTLGGAASTGTGGLARATSPTFVTPILGDATATTLTLTNTGLHLQDTNASHDLILAPGSDLTADRTLTITTGDASRTLTMSGDATISGTNSGDQTITLTGDVTGTGTGSFATTIAAGVVTEAMQVLADNTTQDVSITKHGYAPKAPNDTTKFLRGDATWAVPSGSGSSWALVTQDAAITLDSATHNGKTVELTGSTNRTWAFTAAATLGASWAAILVNSGSAELTLDPNGAETIDGLTTFKMYPGEMRLVTCTGSAFTSFVLKPFYVTGAGAQTFTFTKPPGYKMFGGRIGGGGGAGGKGNTAAGSGGGGGGCTPFELLSSAVGATETITIPAVAAGQTTTNTAGADGGNSTFGSLVTGYGGGGGGAGGATNGGGGGGGALSKGQTGGASQPGSNNTSTGQDYQNGASSPGTGGMPLGGVSYNNATVPANSSVGGGSGSGASTVNGGASIYGGGGGGYFGTTTVQGANGGASEWGGGGGAGGAQDNAPGAGTGGTSSKGGGNGGAGAYDANNATAGTNGANGGGGGGGGGSESGTSGAGGAGSFAVWGVV